MIGTFSREAFINKLASIYKSKFSSASNWSLKPLDTDWWEMFNAVDDEFRSVSTDVLNQKWKQFGFKGF